MDTITSPEIPEFLRLILALGFVLALMGGLAFLMKRLGLSANASAKIGDKKRLHLIEAMPLDARRRLVIIQCDGKEHLVILSATGETVIDTNIQTTVDDSAERHNNT